MDDKSFALETEETQKVVGREAMPATVSLNVSGDRNGEVETGVGVTAYRSHTVDVTVSDVQEYFLKISGAPELAPPTGGTAVPGVGTEGVKGVDMPENRWGYAWNSNAATAGSDDEMTYVSMPATATSLSVPNLQDGNASFSGKLSFGAKFAATSVLGNYTSGVTLSLIATPKSNTGSNHGFWINEKGAPTGLDSGTASMQDAAPDFCSDSRIGTGWTVELEDSRDGKTYTIVKLKDGNCWMQDNLALEADPEKYPDGMVLAPGDTDLPAGVTWTLPAATTAWNTSDNAKAQTRIGSTSLSGWKEGYGNYYSWAAATAGTGNNITGNGSTATGSICPKGWKLPTGGNGGGQFQNLFGASGTDLGSSVQIKFDTVQKAPYAFSAAGYYRGSLGNAGTDGLYWSRTSYSSTNAYLLSFSSGEFRPGTDNGFRFVGYSVRCVADIQGVWNGSTGSGGVLDTGLDMMQDITKTNFTNKYCSKTQNSVVSVGSTMKLFDSRDSKEYTIVKLEDGNCWMQQNLALSGSRMLTSSDSDVSSNFTLPADTTSWGTNTTNNANTVQVKTGSASLSGWQQDYGNYYSWQAATAGTGSSVTNDGGNAVSSICPKGWKLPTGGNNTSSQFQTLFGVNGNNLVNGTTAANYQVKFDKVKAAPYLFPAAGHYNGSLNTGTYGVYWSRTSNSSTLAYRLYFNSGDFAPGTNNGYRYDGFSVRCVAEPAS